MTPDPDRGGEVKLNEGSLDYGQNPSDLRPGVRKRSGPSRTPSLPRDPPAPPWDSGGVREVKLVCMREDDRPKCEWTLYSKLVFPNTEVFSNFWWRPKREY